MVFWSVVLLLCATFGDDLLSMPHTMSIATSFKMESTLIPNTKGFNQAFLHNWFPPIVKATSAFMYSTDEDSTAIDDPSNVIHMVFSMRRRAGDFDFLLPPPPNGSNVPSSKTLTIGLLQRGGEENGFNFQARGAGFGREFLHNRKKGGGDTAER
jgi:hypothetical protein